MSNILGVETKNGLGLLKIELGELNTHSYKAATNIKKINTALAQGKSQPKQSGANQTDKGLTSKQMQETAKAIQRDFEQFDKNLKKVEELSAFKNPWEGLKKAWDNLNWKEIATVGALGLFGPPGSGTGALIQGISTPEQENQLDTSSQPESIGFTPQPPDSTEAQSAPLKSATSGTLAADLPEGSWTAFFDKTAKVFDEALKAVIKGFDVALAKLVTGEGLKEALEGMEIVVKTEKEIAKAETKAEPKEENMSDSGRTDKDQSQFDNLLKNFHDAFDKIGADFGLSVMQAGAQLVMAGANMVTGAVAMAEGLIKLPMRLLDAFTSLFETIINFPEMLSQSVDKFIEALAKLPQAIPDMIVSLIDAVPKLIDAIIAAIPQIIDAFIASIPRIVEALAKAIPKIAGAGVKSMFDPVKKLISGGGLFSGGKGPSMADKLMDESQAYIDSMASTNQELKEFKKGLAESNKTMDEQLKDYRSRKDEMATLREQRAQLESDYAASGYKTVKDEQGNAVVNDWGEVQTEYVGISEKEYAQRLKDINKGLDELNSTNAEFAQEILAQGAKAKAGLRDLKAEKDDFMRTLGKNDKELLKMTRTDIKKLKNKYNLDDEVERAAYNAELYELKKKEWNYEKSVIKERQKVEEERLAKEKELAQKFEEKYKASQKEWKQFESQTKKSLRNNQPGFQERIDSQIKAYQRKYDKMWDGISFNDLSTLEGVDLQKLNKKTGMMQQKIKMNVIKIQKEWIDHKKKEIEDIKKVKNGVKDFLTSVKRSSWGIKDWSKKVDGTKKAIGKLDSKKSNYNQKFMNLNQQLFEDLKQLHGFYQKLLSDYQAFGKSIDDYQKNRDQQGWGLNKWKKVYKSSQTDFNGLDKKAANYEEKALEIFKGQFENLKQIVGLHKKALEGFKGLKSNLKGWIKGRDEKELTKSDWIKRFNKLDSRQGELFKDKKDPATILKVQEDMFAALQNIVSLHEQQISQTKQVISELKSAREKTRSTIENLESGGLSPTETFGWHKEKYKELFRATKTGSATERAKAIEQFADFAPKYLEEAKAKYKSSEQYQKIYDQVLNRLKSSEGFLDDKIEAKEESLEKMTKKDFQSLIDKLGGSIDNNIDFHKKGVEKFEEKIDLLGGTVDNFTLKVADKLQDVQNEMVTLADNLQSFIKDLQDSIKPIKEALLANFHWGEIQAASGGVFAGPDSGYPATLHGTEAVVPLPDGKSIPVIGTDMNAKQLAETNQLLRELIAKQGINIAVEVDGGQLESRIKKVADKNRVEADNRGMAGRAIVQ